jgi:hypothetical protein
MKLYKPKKIGIKQEQKRRKMKDDKNQIEKGEKATKR